MVETGGEQEAEHGLRVAPARGGCPKPAPGTPVTASGCKQRRCRSRQGPRREAAPGKNRVVPRRIFAPGCKDRSRGRFAFSGAAAKAFPSGGGSRILAAESGTSAKGPRAKAAIFPTISNRNERVFMIEIKHLTKEFNDKSGKVVALRDVTATIQDGDIFGIIGMSGAGKSTLLRCLCLLEQPTGGDILLDGENLVRMNGARLRAARRRMGVVFQGYNLLMQKTVFDNVAFPLRLSKNDPAAVKARVTELLEIVGLADRAGAYPSQLSGGQKQRVALARALATNPSVLLCDEPTSALDALTTQSVLALLKKINAELGVTIVIITHELGVVRSICNRMVVIDESRVVEQGDVTEIFAHPQSAIARQLILGGAIKEKEEG